MMIHAGNFNPDFLDIVLDLNMMEHDATYYVWELVSTCVSWNFAGSEKIRKNKCAQVSPL